MSEILYVTSNIDKFNKARINLEPFGITLKHVEFEMDELQSSDGALIVRHKAEQAFAKFGQPLLVNDDTWEVPALNGFPSTGMKLCNQFLVADDWLRLMHGVTDRRIDLVAVFGFHDGQDVHIMTGTDHRFFLNQRQGRHDKSPVLEVVARDDSGQSMAEEISTGRRPETSNTEFWSDLAKLLQAHSA